MQTKKSLTVLHITNDYSGSKVYNNLVRELDYLGLEQVVYTPVKEASSVGKNDIALNTNDSKIIYSNILNKTFDRMFYRLKIRKILRDIESKVDLSKVHFIHAHTWYSDGGVAYRLHQRYGIPFIITVRNSDLNVFQKYLIHERPFGRRILENAKNVLVVSASYKERLKSIMSLKKIEEGLLSKLKVIPNGVDPYWINNAVTKKTRSQTEQFHVLFIGKFTTGKGVLPLQIAVSEINKDTTCTTRIHLHLIGGGGNAHDKVLELVRRHPNTMTFYGKVFEHSDLKRHFEDADIFAMPSRHETFGLVYVEALLQGLPILYTHNEGIDGYYEEKIGEKVFTRETGEIKKKLLSIMQNYDSYLIPTEKLVANHDWRNIALAYYDLYN